MIMRSWFIGACAATVSLTLAAHAAQTARQWKYLPPRDVDPKAAALENPIPRPFYGCYEEPCLTDQFNGRPIPMPERQ